MRDVNNLAGLHSARTMSSANKRSMPRVQSSAYLDLFMQGKEKERLLKENGRLETRQTVIKKRLEEIDRDRNRLQETEATAEARTNAISSERPSTGKDGTKKAWKKMPLNY